eukprot:403349266
MQAQTYTSEQTLGFLSKPQMVNSGSTLNSTPDDVVMDSQMDLTQEIIQKELAASVDSLHLNDCFDGHQSPNKQQLVLHNSKVKNHNSSDFYNQDTSMMMHSNDMKMLSESHKRELGEEEDEFELHIYDSKREIQSMGRSSPDFNQHTSLNQKEDRKSQNSTEKRKLALSGQSGSADYIHENQMSLEWDTKDPRDASLDSSDEGNQNDDKDDSSNTKDDNKNAGRWTDEEHAKFLVALQLFGKNWNKVHKHVGTRSSAQTRSHAQKYFNKLMRRGTKEATEELQLLTRKDSLLKTSIDESTMDGSANQNSSSINGGAGANQNSYQVSPSSKNSPLPRVLCSEDLNIKVNLRPNSYPSPILSQPPQIVHNGQTVDEDILDEDEDADQVQDDDSLGSNDLRLNKQKSKKIKKCSNNLSKSPKITHSSTSFSILNNPKELFKDSKKQKIQASLKFRKDSILSEKRKERSYSKLFEVVKCQQALENSQNLNQSSRIEQNDNSQNNDNSAQSQTQNMASLECKNNNTHDSNTNAMNDYQIEDEVDTFQSNNLQHQEIEYPPQLNPQINPYFLAQQFNNYHLDTQTNYNQDNINENNHMISDSTHPIPVQQIQPQQFQLQQPFQMSHHNPYNIPQNFNNIIQHQNINQMTFANNSDKEIDMNISVQNQKIQSTEELLDSKTLRMRSQSTMIPNQFSQNGVYQFQPHNQQLGGFQHCQDGFFTTMNNDALDKFEVPFVDLSNSNPLNDTGNPSLYSNNLPQMMNNSYLLNQQLHQQQFANHYRPNFNNNGHPQVSNFDTNYQHHVMRSVSDVGIYHKFQNQAQLQGNNYQEDFFDIDNPIISHRDNILLDRCMSPAASLHLNEF